MGSRTMPYVCPHGVEVDAGDFGPCQDCETHGDAECPNFTSCERCDNDAMQARMDWALEHLRANGMVVVACPPGGMSDGLVERLRFVALPLTDEAAAEIERLRAVCGSMDDASRTSRFEFNEDCTLVRTVTTTNWRLP